MKLTDKRKYSQKWHNIKWNKVSKFVSDLQIELVVAYKNNDNMYVTKRYMVPKKFIFII